MLQKIQWHENLSADEKIETYKTVLAILESAGGSIELNDFMENIYKRIDFSKLKNWESSYATRTTTIELVQELIKRGYIRFELLNIYTSRPFGFYTPVINVVRI